jgi:hypothetical protein
VKKLRKNEGKMKKYEGIMKEIGGKMKEKLPFEKSQFW